MRRQLILGIMFVFALSAFSARAEDGQLPFGMTAECSPRNYGIFTGDTLSCVFTFRAPPGLVFDFSGFPRQGDAVNGLEVRSFEASVSRDDKTMVSTLRYTLQVFGVFERTLMVPFGPFSLAWTTERTERGDPVNWRVGTVVPAHVAIAPVSQADYMNPPKPPKGPVVDDKTLTASLRLGGGIVFAVLGLVCAGYTIVSLKKHKLESPFVAAIRVLETDAHSRALRAEFAGEEDCGGADRLALDVFRSCLRKKFKLPAVVTPIDVFHALDSRNLYSPFARRAVELWTSGDKLFYREQKETTGALEKVFALLRELNRRELDELGSPRRQG